MRLERHHFDSMMWSAGIIRQLKDADENLVIDGDARRIGVFVNLGHWLFRWVWK